VFILDTAAAVYLWNGPLANKYEKMKGLEVASRIKDQVCMYMYMCAVLWCAVLWCGVYYI
jgi:hypothetical protein